MTNENDDKQSEHPVQPIQLVAAYSIPDGEVSLADLWLVLVRRRWWIIVTFLIFLGLGVAYALFSPLSYSYTTVLDVGRMTNANGDSVSLRSPESLAALATSVVIPKTVLEYATQHPNDKHLYNFNVEHPQDSNVVVITAMGPTSQQSALKTLQQRMAQQLKQKGERQFKTIRETLAQRANTLKEQVQALRTQQTQLHKAIGNLSADPPGATDSGSQTDQGSSVDQFHAVAMQIRLGNLSDSLSDISKQIASTQLQLGEVEGTLSGLIPPEISATAIQSQRSVSTSRKVVVVVAAFIGLFLGILLALFVNLVARARLSIQH